IDGRARLDQAARVEIGQVGSVHGDEVHAALVQPARHLRAEPGTMAEFHRQAETLQVFAKGIQPGEMPTGMMARLRQLAEQSDQAIAALQLVYRGAEPGQLRVRLLMT